MKGDSNKHHEADAVVILYRYVSAGLVLGFAVSLGIYGWPF